MQRPNGRYDKIARTYSLNWAIAMLIFFPVICCMGFSQFLKYFSQNDSFYLLMGPLTLLVGLFGIYRGVQITHAVVRRLIAGAGQQSQS